MRRTMRRTMSSPLSFDASRALRVLRVRDWSYLMGIALLVFFRHPQAIEIGTVVSVVVFAAIYLCWGYVFNNSFDQQEDDDRKNGFRALGKSTTFAVTFGLSGLLITLAFFWGILLPTIAIMILNVAYSAPPIRLKRFLAPSLAANGLFFGFVYYAAAHLALGRVAPADLAFAAFVFILFLPLQYVHFLEHREEEGLATELPHRLVAVFLFAVLCASVFVPWFATIRESASLVTIYSSAGALVVLRRQPARHLRVDLRWLSLAFGLALVVFFVSR